MRSSLRTRVAQTQEDHASQILCRPSGMRCVEPTTKPFEGQAVVRSETSLPEEVTWMFSVRNADVEGKSNRRSDSTSFQQSGKKLLSTKSCSGATEYVVPTIEHKFMQEVAISEDFRRIVA